MIHVTEDKIEFNGPAKDILLELSLSYYEVRKKLCKDSGMTETEFDIAFQTSISAIKLLDAGMQYETVKEVLDIGGE